MKRAWLTLLSLVMLAGCDTIPAAGPLLRDVQERAVSGLVRYDLIPIDAEVARLSRLQSVYGMPREFLAATPEDYGLINVGDVLSLTIWESVEDGVYTTLGARTAPIEAMEVDELGQIFVPYVGQVNAAGRNIVQIREEIREALSEKSLDPQIEIRRVNANSRNASVQGEVTTPGVFPLNDDTHRLLPLLALAGGSKLQPEQTFVTVRRGVREGRVPLSVIYGKPIYNIPLFDGDVIILDRDQRFYNIIGAVLQPGRREFPSFDMFLIDALAQAGGLNDAIAAPTGVFVFRFEDPKLLARYRHKRLKPLEADNPLDDIGGIEEGGLERIDVNLKGERRVVYQLNLREPDSLFYAQAFQLRNNDLVFVTTAPLNEWRKVIGLIAPTVSQTLGTVNAFDQLAN